uniref:Uncharacterized protein n=1 Tax=Mycena chlorophos TaxID=658473 RepID=A0ABQ0L9C2_MYCCL|nr:predicted protein [Mycena chlorophos]
MVWLTHSLRNPVPTGKLRRDQAQVYKESAMHQTSNMATLQHLRNQYLQSDQYMASPRLATANVWKRKDNGHVLSCRQDGDLVMSVITVVGKVSESALFVNGLGGWKESWAPATPMHKAKYQFQLERPGTSVFVYPGPAEVTVTVEGTIFAADWDVGVSNIIACQNLIKTTNRAENLIVSTNPAEPYLRFIKHAFAAHHWPIDDELEMQFFPAGQEHLFTPLLVKDARGGRVGPQEIAQTMRGNIVEVLFVLKHYRPKDSQKQFYDSFTAYPEEVNVLDQPTRMRTMQYRSWRSILNTVEVARAPAPVRAGRALPPAPPPTPVGNRTTEQEVLLLRRGTMPAANANAARTTRGDATMLPATPARVPPAIPMTPSTMGSPETYAPAIVHTPTPQRSIRRVVEAAHTPAVQPAGREQFASQESLESEGSEPAMLSDESSIAYSAMNNSKVGNSQERRSVRHNAQMPRTPLAIRIQTTRRGIAPYSVRSEGRHAQASIERQMGTRQSQTPIERHATPLSHDFMARMNQVGMSSGGREPVDEQMVEEEAYEWPPSPQLQPIHFRIQTPPQVVDQPVVAEAADVFGGGPITSEAGLAPSTARVVDNADAISDLTVVVADEPDAIFGDTELRYFEDQYGRQQPWLFTGRVAGIVNDERRWVHSKLWQFILLEEPGNPDENEQFAETLERLEEIYRRSHPDKATVDFGRWTTPSWATNKPYIRIYCTSMTQVLKLRCANLQWLESSCAGGPTLRRHAIVRCIVDLQRVDQPIPCEEGDDVVWDIWWRLHATQICVLYKSEERRKGVKPAQVLAGTYAPQDDVTQWERQERLAVLPAETVV